MHVRSGKDHTLHSKVEGQLAWSRDRYTKKQRKRAHMIPMELPNRRFPIPPPFMFHPELQPEFAERNPVGFVPLTIPTKKMKKRQPSQLGCSAVEAGSEKRFNMPVEVGPRTLMRAPALYVFTADGFDEQVEPLRDELADKVEKYFFDKTADRLIGEDN